MVTAGILLADNMPDSRLEVPVLVRLDKRVDGSDSAGLVVTLMVAFVSVVRLMVGLVPAAVAVLSLVEGDGRREVG